MSNFLDQVERISNGINTTTSPEVLKNWVEIQLILAYQAGLDRARQIILSATVDAQVSLAAREITDPIFEEVSNG